MNSKTTEQAAEESWSNERIEQYAHSELGFYSMYATGAILGFRKAEELAQSTITTLQAEVDRLKALVPVWVKSSDRLPGLEFNRKFILVGEYFEGRWITERYQYIFRNNNDWPGGYEYWQAEPAPPINQEK